MPNTDEARIVSQAKRGDRDAFISLHEKHWHAIYNYFLYRLDDQQVVDDLTSEVFVRMIEKIDLYRDTGRPFISWLYTISRNILTDYYRETSKLKMQEPLNDEIMSNQKDPRVTTEHNLMIDCLKLALMYLNEEQKQMIIGKFIEGRTNLEMAQILGKTHGAIKSLQHRALASLRRAIEKEGCYEP
jgi:RNA polymerase sigma-70 factor (ECF subfamily)